MHRQNNINIRVVRDEVIIIIIIIIIIIASLLALKVRVPEQGSS